MPACASPPPLTWWETLTRTTNQMPGSFGCGCELYQLYVTKWTSLTKLCPRTSWAPIRMKCLLGLFKPADIMQTNTRLIMYSGFSHHPAAGLEGSSLCPDHSPDMLDLSRGCFDLTHLDLSAWKTLTDSFIHLLHFCSPETPIWGISPVRWWHSCQLLRNFLTWMSSCVFETHSDYLCAP